MTKQIIIVCKVNVLFESTDWLKIQKYRFIFYGFWDLFIFAQKIYTFFQYGSQLTFHISYKRPIHTDSMTLRWV